MRRDEAEFLPAVLEIQESPPSPLGRAVLLVVILLFAAGIAWATLSHIDTVAVARGKLVPGGRSKVIQPLESGIIRAIRVRDGQAVRKGAVLIELDPTPTTADYQRLSSERLAAQAPDAGQASSLRRVLYGLYALVKVHFAKEEELYLPLLDERLSPEEARAMFEAMERAAGEAKARRRG